MTTKFKDREIEVIERDGKENVTKTMTCAEFIKTVPTAKAWLKKGAENFIRIYPGPHGTTVYDYIRFRNFYRHVPRPDVANEAELAKVKLTSTNYLASGGGNPQEGEPPIPITTLANIKKSTLPKLYDQLRHGLVTSDQQPELLDAARDVTTPLGVAHKNGCFTGTCNVCLLDVLDADFAAISTNTRHKLHKQLVLFLSHVDNHTLDLKRDEYKAQHDALAKCPSSRVKCILCLDKLMNEDYRQRIRNSTDAYGKERALVRRKRFLKKRKREKSHEKK